MGGTIDVCSVPGEGSVFTVEIDPGPPAGAEKIEPRLEEGRTGGEIVAAGSKPPQQGGVKQAGGTGTAGQSGMAAGAQRLAGISILLVDDGLDNQLLISHMLKNVGAAVEVAANGQIACEKVMAAWKEDRSYDVILMDMQMPVLDGYGASRQLRQAGYTRPIIAVTAHAMPEDRQKCLDAGCSDYITKPVQWEKMFEMIMRFAGAVRERESGSSIGSVRKRDVGELSEAVHYQQSGVMSMHELAWIFLNELPARVQALEQAIRKSDTEQLSYLSHLLKGSAGSFGYNDITQAAGVVEDLTRSQADVAMLQRSANELLGLCKEALADAPAAQQQAGRAAAPKAAAVSQPGQ
jgi:CheY-like chemotaxis protein